MTAYYNEFDPAAAAVLDALIDNGEVPYGVVDRRSILDVSPSDLKGFTQCHFFAGFGVWPLALRAAGWPDDRPVWTGSCPCQPFSAVGGHAGQADERHLWPAWFHLISLSLPPDLFGEQVASKDAGWWLDLVCADMEGVGYAIGASVTTAAGAGAPHLRERTYIAAYTPGERVERLRYPRRPRQGRSRWESSPLDLLAVLDSPFVAGDGYPKPLLRTGHDGFAGAVQLLRGYGNALDLWQAEQWISTFLESEAADFGVWYHPDDADL